VDGMKEAPEIQEEIRRRLGLTAKPGEKASR